MAHNPASQVHLSLGKNASEAVVTWSTPLEGASSAVQFSLCNNATASDDAVALLHKWMTPPQEVQGYVRKFVDNGTLHHTQFIHRATLKPLEPASRYCYRVADNATLFGGAGDGWSRLHTFRTFRGFSAEWDSPRITVLGDFGLWNARSLPSLEKDVRAERSDLLVHNGDLA